MWLLVLIELSLTLIIVLPSIKAGKTTREIIGSAFLTVFMAGIVCFAFLDGAQPSVENMLTISDNSTPLPPGDYVPVTEIVLQDGKMVTKVHNELKSGEKFDGIYFVDEGLYVREIVKHQSATFLQFPHTVTLRYLYLPAIYRRGE